MVAGERCHPDRYVYAMQCPGNDPAISTVIAESRRDEDTVGHRSREAGRDDARDGAARGLHETREIAAGGLGPAVPLGGLLGGEDGDVHGERVSGER